MGADCIFFFSNSLWATRDCALHRGVSTPCHESLWSHQGTKKIQRNKYHVCQIDLQLSHWLQVYLNSRVNYLHCAALTSV